MRLDAFLFACALAILLHGPFRASLLRFLTAPTVRALSCLLLIAVWTATLAGSAPATGALVQSALLPCILASVIFWPVPTCSGFSNPHRCAG